MTVRIEVEPQAIAQLDELDAWWREHRPDSRTSVLEEFGHVIAALREQPARFARTVECVMIGGSATRGEVASQSEWITETAETGSVSGRRQSEGSGSGGGATRRSWVSAAGEAR